MNETFPHPSSESTHPIGDDRLPLEPIISVGVGRRIVFHVVQIVDKEEGHAMLIRFVVVISSPIQAIVYVEAGSIIS
jgi:hypothetical protein